MVLPSSDMAPVVLRRGDLLTSNSSSSSPTICSRTSSAVTRPDSAAELVDNDCDVAAGALETPERSSMASFVSGTTVSSAHDLAEG